MQKWQVIMNTLKELFLSQVNRILNRKFYSAAGLSENDFLKNYLTPLEQLLKESFASRMMKVNRIPILIVVPRNIVSLSYQLKSIRESIKDTLLEYIIQPEWFKNAEGVLTPDKPYLLLDVETGYEMINTAPKRCVEAFNEAGRFALTMDEGLAIVTHFPEVLASHWVDLPGSKLIHHLAGQDAQRRGASDALPPGFAKTTFVPTLNYKYYNSLRLNYVSEDNETPYSGSASCAQRLAIPRVL
jgi:hypothetical protein